MKYKLLIIYMINIFLSSGVLTARMQKLTFDHVNMDDGLSNSTVQVIYKDRYGFMWFGTLMGLNKFDGYEFTVYKYNPTDSTSLSDNTIHAIYEDSFGNFWIGTSHDGLNLFDRQNEIFIKYKHDSLKEGSISSNNIRDIFEDKYRRLWICTDGGGLNLFERETNTFYSYKKGDKQAIGLESNNLLSVSNEDFFKNYWISTSDGKLIKFNVEDMLFSSISVDDNHDWDTINYFHNYVFVDSDNDVWFGTENGLYMYNQLKNNITHYSKQSDHTSINNNLVTGIVELNKNQILIATDHGGLNLFDKRKNHFYYYLSNKFDNTTIVNNQLYSLYKDDRDFIWVSSHKEGINIYAPGALKFNKGKDLPGNHSYDWYNYSVNDICEDNNGNIWFGFDGQGIIVYNPNTHISIHHQHDPNDQNSLSSDVIVDLHKDINGNIWIGTFLKGLVKYDVKDKKFYRVYIDPNSSTKLVSHSIWTITEDSLGNIIAGTVGNGLSMINPTKETINNYYNIPDDSTSVNNNFINKTYIDKDNTLWVNTRNGIQLFNRETNSFINLASIANIPYNMVRSMIFDILNDKQERLWIGTNAGLFLYRKQSKDFVEFSVNDGLPGEIVYCIIQDTANYLWLSTNRGISRFNPENNTFRNYDQSDGITVSPFNDDAGLIASDGTIYFGGARGICFFKPNEIKDYTIPPPIYLTDFKIFDKSITPKTTNSPLNKHINFVDTIKLSYDQSSISFEFATLTYSHQDKNQYSYKLEGFDKYWSNPSHLRNASYTNLYPGKYTFKVKGSNDDGIWNNGKEVSIIISPPFWQTVWFHILEGIVVIFIIITGISHYEKYREKKILKERQILRQKVEERTIVIEQQKEELRNQTDYLDTLNKTKDKFFSILAHDLRSPFNSILGFSELLKINKEKLTPEKQYRFIDAIHLASKRVYTLIEDLLLWSISQTNQIKFEPGNLNLKAIVDENILLLKDNFLSKNISCEVTIEDNLQIYADYEMINTVFRNLLSNAIKFTHNGGKVTIKGIKEDNAVEVSICDTGIGISEAEINDLFKIEKTRSKLGTNKEEGTGLGLSICKEFINAHKGEIWVKSKVGKGSTFYLKIPLPINK